MARFKFLRGKETELPNILVDGNIYFCTDSGKFFVDYLDKNGTVVRKQVVAEYAEKLKIIEENEENEIGAKEILERLDNKVEKEEGKNLSTNDFTNEFKELLEDRVTTPEEITPIESKLVNASAVWEFVNDSIDYAIDEFKSLNPIDEELSVNSPNLVQNRAVSIGIQTLENNMSNDYVHKDYIEVDLPNAEVTSYKANNGIYPCTFVDTKAREMIGDIETTLDNIIAMQANLIGGDTE